MHGNTKLKKKTQNEFKSTTLTFWPIRITHCISSDDGGSGCGVMSATGGKSRSETRTGSSGSCHATNFVLLPMYRKIKPLFHSMRKNIIGPYLNMIYHATRPSACCATHFAPVMQLFSVCWTTCLSFSSELLRLYFCSGQLRGSCFISHLGRQRWASGCSHSWWPRSAWIALAAAATTNSRTTTSTTSVKNIHGIYNLLRDLEAYNYE